MKKGMKNLSLLLGVAVASQVSSAITVDLKPGVLGYRTITKDEFGEKPNSFEPGASIGLEIMSGKPEDGFRWGLGSEYQTELNGKRGYKAFSSVPVYAVSRIGIGHSSTGNAFYIPVRLGYQFNFEDRDTIKEAKDGFYYAAGVGKQFAPWFNAELLYEGSTYKLTDNNDKNHSGTESQVSLKLGFTFGAGEKRDYPVLPAARPVEPIVVTPEKPAPIGKTMDLTVSGAYFDFDKATVKENAKQEIRGAAQQIKNLNQNNNLTGVLDIAGHTDSKGAKEYNQKLSERRAAAVADVYTQVIGTGNGIRYNVAGDGEDRPVAPNTLPNGKDNPEGRARNRRVEVKFYPDNKIIRENNTNYELDVESQIK